MTSHVLSLKGSQAPRLCSLPVGVVSDAPGRAAVAQARAAGLDLDPWQQTVLRESLGVRSDGKWAAFSVGLIVPRQNGKGAVLEALALAMLFQFNAELVLRHQFRKQPASRARRCMRQDPAASAADERRRCARACCNRGASWRGRRPASDTQPS